MDDLTRLELRVSKIIRILQSIVETNETLDERIIDLLTFAEECAKTHERCDERVTALEKLRIQSNDHNKRIVVLEQFAFTLAPELQIAINDRLIILLALTEKCVYELEARVRRLEQHP